MAQYENAVKSLKDYIRENADKEINFEDKAKMYVHAGLIARYREQQTKEVYDVPAKGHTPGTAVTENNVAATCTKDGSYDTVVYCIFNYFCTICIVHYITECDRTIVPVNFFIAV